MNQSLVNNFLLNSENPTFAESTSSFDMLQFDGFSLQNDHIITEQMDIFSPPSRELVTFRIPRNDGARMNGNYFRERIVRVTGHIVYGTSAELQVAMDEFKRRLSVPERYLDLKVNDVVRRAVATLSSSQSMFAGRKGSDISETPFDIEFTILDPFFHDIEYTSASLFSSTALALAETVENYGTTYARPILSVIIEAASGVTGFTFQNLTNGKSITVTTPLVAGDLLVIDTEESTVELNGVGIDYSGLFPTLEYGSNNCVLLTTGSSVQHTSTIAYKQSYL